MNTAAVSTTFEEFVCIARKASMTGSAGEITATGQKPALRIALLYGEELRFPERCGWLLKILSGKAWVSFGGRDFTLESGESLDIPKVKNGAILSAVGKEAIFFEIR